MTPASASPAANGILIRLPAKLRYLAPTISKLDVKEQRKAPAPASQKELQGKIVVMLCLYLPTAVKNLKATNDS